MSATGQVRWEKLAGKQTAESGEEGRCLKGKARQAWGLVCADRVEGCS